MQSSCEYCGTGRSLTYLYAPQHLPRPYPSNHCAGVLTHTGHASQANEPYRASKCSGLHRSVLLRLPLPQSSSRDRKLASVQSLGVRNKTPTNSWVEFSFYNYYINSRNCPSTLPKCTDTPVPLGEGSRMPTQVLSVMLGSG